MYSESLLEIGLTSIGWMFYGKIILFITTLNLHLLPFVFMMMRNWWETSRSQDAGYATVTEVKRTTSDFLVMAIVVLLFWYPSSKTTFNPNQYINNTPESTIQSITPNNTSSIEVPPGWWLIMFGSKAAVTQIIEWFPFDARAQTTLHAMNTMRIEDPDLQFQVDAFASYCYYPTLKKWQYETKTPIPKPASDSITDRPQFIGNSMFLETKGYYKQCHQTDTDSGGCYGTAESMPVEVAQRYSIQSKHLMPADDGYPAYYATVTPSCYTWWTGNEDNYYDISGIPSDYVPLRKALVEEAKNHFLKFPNSHNNLNMGTEAENQLIIQLLSNDQPSLSGQSKDWDEMGFWDLLKNGAMYVIGVIGGSIMAWLLSIAIDILKPLLFMLQGLAIFGVIMSMSITMVFGGFRPDVVFKHGAFLITILFLPLWWHAADFLNEVLLRMLYPQYENGVVAAVTSEGIVAVIYFIFLLLAYLSLPVYFVKFMGQAGAEAADVAGDAMSLATDASKKGSGAGSRFLKGGFRK